MSNLNQDILDNMIASAASLAEARTQIMEAMGRLPANPDVNENLQEAVTALLSARTQIEKIENRLLE